ncbi:MAG: AmmeMemoRadiSam system protein A [Ignavibacteriales bacterium CG_4_9_14_3_um_filter_34_10]|nr:MAG: AmmeMemoRadiSam system protein A [Ignavibacteriales bacterium CG_4_9_14_3_um_filter_34_10]
MELTIEDKKILLIAARNSIKNIFKRTLVNKPDFELFTNMKQKAGAFVTLTINNRLRGCIGFIFSDNYLFDTVCTAAVEAAVGDPRFPILSEKEFNHIQIEVSVLSPPFKMNSYEEIIIGKHGLIVDEKEGKGLLLPQVPIEHNMDKDEYLTSLCRKAGLRSNLWKEKLLNIKMFTATVFSEKEVFNNE